MSAAYIKKWVSKIIAYDHITYIFLNHVKIRSKPISMGWKE